MQCLNIYEVAKRYKVSASTIFAWRVRGWIIEPKRIGGKVYWTEDDLQIWDSADNPRPCNKEKVTT